MPNTADVEPNLLLRRIVEEQAYRRLIALNILGHCLKYVGELDAKQRVAEELEVSLQIFREVRALYADLGWEDLESAVRDRLDEIPMPESRIEFSISRMLSETAETVAMESYVDSSSKPFGAIALSALELTGGFPARRAGLFSRFCEEPGNRPGAQQLFDRWFAISALSMGRPGSRGDRRAVELGLRSKSSAEMTDEFLARVQPLVERCGLVLPADVMAELGPRAEGAR